MHNYYLPLIGFWCGKTNDRPKEKVIEIYCPPMNEKTQHNHKSIFLKKGFLPLRKPQLNIKNGGSGCKQTFNGSDSERMLPRVSGL